MKLLLNQTFLATEFRQLVKKFLIKMFTINAKPSMSALAKLLFWCAFIENLMKTSIAFSIFVYPCRLAGVAKGEVLVGSDNL